MSQFEIQWVDSGREPKVTPNPKYPDGIDLDIAHGKKPSCFTLLPYPAKRIGHYTIRCLMCGLGVACTTAGRPDDPRSITMPCRRL